MYGEFIYTFGPVNMLITVKESINNEVPDVTIGIVGMDMPLNIKSIMYENEVIFMVLEIPMLSGDLEISAKFKDYAYEIGGSHPMIGEISGVAKPFTGETGFSKFLKVLPTKKTNKKVTRTEKEIDKLVNELLSKMTLEEKIGQMSQSAGMNTSAIGAEKEQTLTIDELIKKGLVGSLISISSPDVTFEQQRIAVEESRLGIPLMFCQDVIHGRETIFPIPLGWACSFNPELIGKAAEVAAKESTPIGIMYGFSPMLDIARDARWGRVSEGNGEDPYLCSKICEAHVKGFQGETLGETDHSMIACLKHFIGYGAAEGGRDYNTCEITETTLRNVYLPPFKAGIKAGAGSIMNSFNTINSVPVAVNKPILRDLLRDELGFQGIVVSDYAAVEEVIAHGVAEDGADAAIKAVEASMDIEMTTTLYNDNLEKAVEDKTISIELIDEAVSRILTYKYKMGLMDDPYKYFQPDKMKDIFNPEFKNISLELAEESIVLLKNNGVLPLDKEQSIAVIGPKGDSKDMLGPWQFSSKINETVTLLDGLKNQGYKVSFEAGSDIDEKIVDGIKKATDLAKQSDVIILALGESAAMSGEAASRQNITIPDVQMELAYAMKKTGKPIILVLTNGRPLLLNWFDENIDAIVETWFLGTMAGDAIGNILSGKYNPSGKLSVTFPRHTGQLPIYYNHLNTGRPFKDGMKDKFLSRYIDGLNAPLYEFGFGLSYTKFEIKNLTLSSHEINDDGEIIATVNILNAGKVEGTQTVQLYIRDVAASIARPVKELKGFKKIKLMPNENKEVSFTITEPMLRFYNAYNKEVSEAGKFEIMIGSSSKDENMIKSEFRLNK